MALDNPSYFSLSGGSLPSSGAPGNSGVSSSRGFAAFFRKRQNKMGSVSSASVMSNSTGSTMTHHESNRSIESVDESQPMLSRSMNSSSQRRSFRNLSRSMSAHTDNETLQILKGEPRPTDIAPPSPHLPHRSHSHSDHDRRRPHRRRILKSASELLSNDMVFYGLPGDTSRGQDEEGEVFLGIDDARYYNLSATLPAPGSSGIRRHSIGTFLEEEGIPKRAIIQTEGFIKEPEGFAPPIPTDQVDGRQPTRARRCRKHKSFKEGSRMRTGIGAHNEATNANLMEDRDDVVFVSSKDSEASTLWVNYLTACFEQISRQQGRPPFKVRHVTVEDAVSVTQTMQDRIAKSRLQIIVVCPVLLDRATTKPEQASALARQLSPERVLAMMLGVHDGQLTENQKSALITYPQWRKFFVKDQDETFVGEFLGAAVAILGSSPPATLKNDKTTFSVHPKKVKIGQNRVLVIMNEPLRDEDTVSVIIDRCGEGIDLTQVKRRNPYTLQLAVPDRCLQVSMLIGVRVIVNGVPQGVRQVKCESRLRELDQILRAHDNPLEFMCQTFGFNPGDRDQLDNWMVHAFQRNLPPRFDLLATPNGATPLQRNATSPEEYPTLLHFAARFGLEKLAWQLLECPGGEIACDLKNVAELTPADVAEQAGHNKLAQQLRGYMQMNEFTNMYSYLKVISENAGSGANNESASPLTHLNCLDTEHDKEDYCRPRPLSEAYLVPPAARPVTTAPQLLPLNTISHTPTEMNYSIVPPPTPVLGVPPTNLSNSDVNGLNLPLQGYLKMYPASPKVSPSLPAPVTAPLLALRSPNHPQQSKKDLKEDTPGSRTGSLHRSTSNHGVKSREPSGPQDELLEIINDFKNNVFTISEVERLVENWRNRNDVQQSFKDKQRQLAAMRDEYDRIQKKLKDEMKAPTPFDKIKKFFSKGKKESKESNHADDDGASTSSKNEKSSETGAERRPISSLSLHSVSSSSSSGRMSIISGCSGTSLGDSGTHSDTEDRRLRNSREDKGGIMTYEVPPAPKPFTGRYSPMRYTPSPRSSGVHPETESRKPHPQNGSSSDEYYIAFPVSGLPVHSFNPDGTPIEPKTPCSPCDAPLFQISNNIPEEDNHSDAPEKTEIKEINSLPQAPPPPPSSPPTHLSLDYINIVPANIPSSVLQTPVNESLQENNERIEVSLNVTKILNEEPVKALDGETKIINETTKEEVPVIFTQSDHVRRDGEPKLPEYMNISPGGDQEPRVIGTIPKKPTAPPVPPRAQVRK
ncbi:phosphoinositide 3-kinase adapter protein 1 isoform X2 [Fopius arisanus]|uniref:Phosphoinositide 3-kinase adapter protein 1 isoform X2 n=1 Tax=Fopius arisanus TaxID=64838 RepID=A0A9R1TAP7_9HYME|nr:PREDICTED: phosphoinositide 3-kinase adapter protein 1 isoform X2 [Fopius arisanus]